MKTLLLITVLCGLILAAHPGHLRAQDREFDEYEVKAVFLANFFKFVEWPSTDRHYSICIYGSDPFGQSMRIIRGIKIRGRAVEVKRPASVKGFGDCNVLFISSSERRHISSLLDAVKGMDLLTVGDTEGYGREGVMVNFYIEAKRVKFEINFNSIRRSRITVSSQLLKLGRMVGQ